MLTFSLIHLTSVFDHEFPNPPFMTSISNSKPRRKQVGAQIERLKRDSRELQNYIKRKEREGNMGLVFKLRKKQAYLDDKIVEFEREFAA